MNLPATGIFLSMQLTNFAAAKLMTATTTTLTGVDKAPRKYPTNGARIIICIRYVP